MRCVVCWKEMRWRDNKYLRCVCGMMYPASVWKTCDEKTHKLFGNWYDHEVVALDKALDDYEGRDFSFFKGRKIITFWNSSNQIVIMKNFGELIYHLTGRRGAWLSSSHSE